MLLIAVAVEHVVKLTAVSVVTMAGHNSYVQLLFFYTRRHIIAVVASLKAMQIKTTKKGEPEEPWGAQENPKIAFPESPWALLAPSTSPFFKLTANV